MKLKSLHKAIVASAAALAFSGTAMAGVVTMESVAAGSTYLATESFSQAGATLTVNGNFGVVDTVAAFGAGVGLDLAAPKGNATQFFTGVNDASVSVTEMTGAAFRIAGFDFGFVAALNGLFGPGDLAGLMVAAYETETGATGFESWSFGAADAQGQFSFVGAGRGDMGALGGSLKSVEFFACTANDLGQCVQRNGNFSQFAIDNIFLVRSDVPEPGSLALAALALGIAGGLRARRAVKI